MHATSGRRYVTARGIAFEAKPTNDGTWHGHPIPWNQVPPDLKDRWLDEGKVRSADLRRYRERPRGDIRWALETDDNA